MTRIVAIAITTGSLVELGSAVVRVEWTGYSGEKGVTLGYTYDGQPSTATLGETQLVTVYP